MYNSGGQTPCTWSYTQNPGESRSNLANMDSHSASMQGSIQLPGAHMSENSTQYSREYATLASDRDGSMPLHSHESSLSLPSQSGYGNVTNLSNQPNRQNSAPFSSHQLHVVGYPVSFPSQESSGQCMSFPLPSSSGPVHNRNTSDDATDIHDVATTRPALDYSVGSYDRPRMGTRTCTPVTLATHSQVSGNMAAPGTMIQQQLPPPGVTTLLPVSTGAASYQQIMPSSEPHLVGSQVLVSQPGQMIMSPMTGQHAQVVTTMSGPIVSQAQQFVPQVQQPGVSGMMAQQIQAPPLGQQPGSLQPQPGTLGMQPQLTRQQSPQQQILPAGQTFQQSAVQQQQLPGGFQLQEQHQQQQQLQLQPQPTMQHPQPQQQQLPQEQPEVNRDSGGHCTFVERRLGTEQLRDAKRKRAGGVIAQIDNTSDMELSDSDNTPVTPAPGDVYKAVIYMANLVSDVTIEDIRNLLIGLDGVSDFAIGRLVDSSTTRVCAFIETVSKMATETLVKGYHKYAYKGRCLVTRLAEPIDYTNMKLEFSKSSDTMMNVQVITSPQRFNGQVRYTGKLSGSVKWKTGALTLTKVDGGWNLKMTYDCNNIKTPNHSVLNLSLTSRTIEKCVCKESAFVDVRTSKELMTVFFKGTRRSDITTLKQIFEDAKYSSSKVKPSPKGMTIVGREMSPLIGMSYVTEYIDSQTSTSGYFCYLCDSLIPDGTFLVNHITSQDHRLKYVEIARPDLHKLISGIPSQLASLKELLFAADEVEKKEGRQTIKVVYDLKPDDVNSTIPSSIPNYATFTEFAKIDAYTKQLAAYKKDQKEEKKWRAQPEVKEGMDGAKRALLIRERIEEEMKIRRKDRKNHKNKMTERKKKREDERQKVGLKQRQKWEWETKREWETVKRKAERSKERERQRKKSTEVDLKEGTTTMSVNVGCGTRDIQDRDTSQGDVSASRANHIPGAKALKQPEKGRKIADEKQENVRKKLMNERIQIRKTEKMEDDRSMAVHDRRKQHDEDRRTGREEDLQDMVVEEIHAEDVAELMACRLTGIIHDNEAAMLGLQYITEMHAGSSSKSAKYECSLCDYKCNSDFIVLHITGLQHRMRFLEEFHDEEFRRLSAIPDLSERRSQLEHCAKLIEVDLGRQEVTVQILASDNDGSRQTDEMTHTEKANINNENIEMGEVQHNIEMGEEQHNIADKDNNSGNHITTFVKQNNQRQEQKKCLKEERLELTEEVRDGGGHEGMDGDSVVPTTGDTTCRLKELMLDNDAAMLGLQFITEVHTPGCSLPRYVCCLCLFKCNIAFIVPHITGLQHRMLFLEKFHEEEHKKLSAITDSVEKRCQLDHCAKLIEVDTGRQEVQMKMSPGDDVGEGEKSTEVSETQSRRHSAPETKDEASRASATRRDYRSRHSRSPVSDLPDQRSRTPDRSRNHRYRKSITPEKSRRYHGRKSRSPDCPRAYRCRRSRSPERRNEYKSRRSRSSERRNVYKSRKSRSPERRNEYKGRKSRSPERRNEYKGRKSRSPERRNEYKGRKSRSPERRNEYKGRKSRSPERRNEYKGRKSRSPERRNEYKGRKSSSPERSSELKSQNSRSPKSRRSRSEDRGNQQPSADSKPAVAAELYTRLKGLDNTPLVGLSFIVEERGAGCTMYQCKLCNRGTGPGEIVNHITSIRHKSKFLEKKYPAVYSVSQDKAALVEQHVNSIENLKGRESISVQINSEDNLAVASDPVVVPIPTAISKKDEVGKPFGVDARRGSMWSKRNLGKTVKAEKHPSTDNLCENARVAPLKVAEAGVSPAALNQHSNNNELVTDTTEHKANNIKQVSKPDVGLKLIQEIVAPTPQVNPPRGPFVHVETLVEPAGCPRFPSPQGPQPGTMPGPVPWSTLAPPPGIVSVTCVMPRHGIAAAGPAIPGQILATSPDFNLPNVVTLEKPTLMVPGPQPTPQIVQDPTPALHQQLMAAPTQLLQPPCLRAQPTQLLQPPCLRAQPTQLLQPPCLRAQLLQLQQQLLRPLVHNPFLTPQLPAMPNISMLPHGIQQGKTVASLQLCTDIKSEQKDTVPQGDKIIGTIRVSSSKTSSHSQGNTTGRVSKISNQERKMSDSSFIGKVRLAGPVTNTTLAMSQETQDSTQDIKHESKTIGQVSKLAGPIWKGHSRSDSAMPVSGDRSGSSEGRGPAGSRLAQSCSGQSGEPPSASDSCKSQTGPATAGNQKDGHIQTGMYLYGGNIANSVLKLQHPNLVSGTLTTPNHLARRVNPKTGSSFKEQFSVPKGVLDLAIGVDCANIRDASNLEGITSIRVNRQQSYFSVTGTHITFIIRKPAVQIWKVFEPIPTLKKLALLEGKDSVDAARKMLEYGEYKYNIPREFVARFMGTDGCNVQNILDMTGAATVRVLGDEDGPRSEVPFVFVGNQDSLDAVMNHVDFNINYLECSTDPGSMDEPLPHP